MNRHPRIILAALAAATTVAGSAGVAAAAGGPAVIRFGEVGGTSVRSVGGRPQGVGLVPLAIERGFFKEELGEGGPRIEVLYFAGTGPAQNEALAQGDIDFGSYGGLPNVIGLAGGIPAKVVAVRQVSTTGYHVGVHPDSPIKALTDLRGKRIAVQKGTNPYQSLVRYLEAKGIAEREVNIVNLQGGEALVAFNARAVDAVFQSTNLLLLRDQGKARIIATTRDFQHDGTASGVLVAERFEKAHPELVAKVVKVLTRAAWWASQEQNREQLLRFISERSFAYQYVKDEYAGSLNARYNPVIDESVVRSYTSTARFASQHKLIRKEPDGKTIRSWFEPKYQQAALQQLGIARFWTTPIAAAP